MNAEQLGGRGAVALALAQGGLEHRGFSQFQELLVERGVLRPCARLLGLALGPLRELGLDLVVSRFCGGVRAGPRAGAPAGSCGLGRRWPRARWRCEARGRCPPSGRERSSSNHLIGEMRLGDVRQPRLAARSARPGPGCPRGGRGAAGGGSGRRSGGRTGPRGTGPAAMSSASGRFVAAMTRMSVGRGRASPTGVTSRCSMARSSLTWRSAGRRRSRRAAPSRPSRARGAPCGPGRPR